jgi:hypothetical protein
MKLFKGIGDLLRLGRDGIFKSLKVVTAPLKGIIVSLLTGAAKNGIEGEVKERLLGFLANEYEDKAMKKIVEYVSHLFNLLEKAVAVFPDFLEPSILKKLQELESAILKFLDRLDVRIDEMKKDGKITNEELDIVVNMIIFDLINDVKAVFADVMEMFQVEEKKPVVIRDPIVSMKEVLEEKPSVFSSGASEYIKALKEKHAVKE